VTAAVLAGRYLEARARDRSGLALSALAALGAKSVAVLRDGSECRVPAGELAAGDLFVVRPGEKIGTDGIVAEGRSAVDASLVTGESMPAEVGPGDPVTGATVNAGGRLVVRATAVGADTAVARIGRMVQEAQTGKSSAQRLADRVSAVFVPAVIAIALLTLLAWLATGHDTGRSIEVAVAVLIVACPCALGLAIPTAILVGSGRGAQLGIVIRRPEALERAGKVTTIVLDKTGTVTDGHPEVDGLRLAPGADRTATLRLAGAVAAANDHPVSRAVAAYAAREVGDLPDVSDLHAVPGLGVAAGVEGHQVEIGRNGTAGATEVRIDGTPAAWLSVGDRPRPSSREAVGLLRKLGLTPVLLTGDSAANGERVAQEVGIDSVIADVLPEQKLAEIKRLRATGELVAMAGDGTNDAPALAAADLGIAMGGGTDVAIEAGDLTLVGGDLRSAADAVSLARATRRTMVQNLGWAFTYNAVLIPLAVAGLLNPMVAAAAMACSSLAVVGNSLRLRRFTGFRKEMT
jgi:Cu+-exporting ATPase